MKPRIRFTAALILGLWFGAAGPSIPQEIGPPAGTVLGIPWRPGLAGALRGLDLDVLGRWEGVLYLRADAMGRARLSRAGLPSFEPQGLFPNPPRTASEAAGGPNGAYHSYQELETELAALQARFPDLAKVTSLGLSLEKRRLLALKISDHPDRDEDEAGVLFVGGHHAREWISVEVPLLIAKSLLESYASDPSVRDLVDASEIWIVPMINPDGVEYSIRSYRYWRKNRRDNGDGSFGVDLNRNYGHQWGTDEIGSSSDPSSEVFRGRAAFSEPESRAVRDLLLRRSFAAAVSYHSFDQLLLYPWSYTAQPAPRRNEFEALARGLAVLIEAVGGRIYGVGQSGEDLYVSNGDAMDWTYAALDAPALTIELPPADLVHGGFLNAEADIEGIFRENLPAALEIVRAAILAYRPVASRRGEWGGTAAATPGRPRIR